MRRRFILFIFIAILTFAIGVSVDRLFYRFVPVTVSLCQLVRHPERYNGKLVRVEAPAMASFGVATVFDDSCKDGGVAARVMPNESFQ